MSLKYFDISPASAPYGAIIDCTAHGFSWVQGTWVVNPKDINGGHFEGGSQVTFAPGVVGRVYSCSPSVLRVVVPTSAADGSLSTLVAGAPVYSSVPFAVQGA